MREIKFRAWDKNLNSSGGMIWNAAILNGKYFDIFEMETRDYPLMQFTGRKDKNGDEIYEGDIVEVVLPGNTEARNITIARGKVFYDEASFRVPTGVHISSWVRLDSLANNVEIRIIGNTFENPELLEEG